MEDIRKFCEKRNGVILTQKINNTLEPVTYTAAQVASMLQVSQLTARKIIDEENIRRVPYIKNYIVFKSAFDDWVASSQK